MVEKIKALGANVDEREETCLAVTGDPSILQKVKEMLDDEGFINDTYSFGMMFGTVLGRLPAEDTIGLMMVTQLDGGQNGYMAFA